MTEPSYEVVAELVLKNGVTPTLAAMSRALRDTDTVINTVIRSLRSLDESGAALAGAARAASQLGRSAARAAEGTQALNAALAVTVSHAGRLDMLAASMRSLATATRDAASAERSTSRRGPAAPSFSPAYRQNSRYVPLLEDEAMLWRYGGGAYAPGQAAWTTMFPGSYTAAAASSGFNIDAYTTRLGRPPGPIVVPPGPGVIPPGQGVPPGAGGGGGPMSHLGGNMHMGPGGIAARASLGSGALFWPVVAGTAYYYGGKSLVDAGMDYQSAALRYRAMGFSPADNAATMAAVRGTHVFGASRTELLNTMSAASSYFGSPEEGRRYAPALLQAFKTLSMISGKNFDFDSPDGLGLLRFLDRRGAFTSSQRFNEEMDLATRIITGTGGKADGQMLGGMARTGGAAFTASTDKAITSMVSMALEMGGSRAFTGLMSVFQNLVAGRGTEQSKAAMASLGLGKLTKETIGWLGNRRVQKVGLKGIPDFELLQTDFPAWVEKDLLPALVSHGYTTTAQQAVEINNLMSNRTSSNIGTQIATQLSLVKRDQAMIEHANGLTATEKLYGDSAQGAVDDFRAAWKDFKTTMSADVLPKFTSFLRGLTTFLQTLDEVYTSLKETYKDSPVGLAFGAATKYVMPGSILAEVAKRVWDKESKLIGNGAPGGPTLAGLPDDTAGPATPGTSPNVAGKRPIHLLNTTVVQVDGKVVAQAVNHVLVNESRKADASTGADPTHIPMRGVQQP